MSDYDSVRVGKLVLKGESSKCVSQMNRAAFSNRCPHQYIFHVSFRFTEQKNVSISIRIRKIKVTRSDWLLMKMHKSTVDGGVQQNSRISPEQLRFNLANEPISRVWIMECLHLARHTMKVIYTRNYTKFEKSSDKILDIKSRRRSRSRRNIHSYSDK